MPSLNAAREYPANGDYVTATFAPFVPPCLAYSVCCRRNLEYSACCRAQGACGISSCAKPGSRKGLMTVALLLNLFALGATILGACSLASDKKVLRNTFWARGQINNVTVNANTLPSNRSLAEMFPKLAEWANSSSGAVGRVGPVKVELFIGLSGVAGLVTEHAHTDGILLRESFVYRDWKSEILCENLGNATKEFCAKCKVGGDEMGR